MNRNSAIPQHGFRAGRRNRDIIAFLGKRDVPVFIFLNIRIGHPPRERVFEVPHVACHFDIFDFKIGNSCLEMWVPIDQTFAAIDQTFIVHLNKDFDHGVREVARHGERFTVPITRRTKAFELVDDLTTRFLFPLPNLR